jgi:hypothetical protein
MEPEKTPQPTIKYKTVVIGVSIAAVLLALISFIAVQLAG